MAFQQIWPGDSATESQDLPPGIRTLSLNVGQFDRGTYGYSLSVAPAAAEAATIAITRIFHPRPSANDKFPMPASGVLLNPGAAVLQSSAAFGNVAYQRFEFTIDVTETLQGFRLYADVRKRSELR